MPARFWFAGVALVCLFARPTFSQSPSMTIDDLVRMTGPQLDAIYAAGNVLTGKGNIKDSLDSGSEIGTLVAERYLGLAEDGTRAPLAEGARQAAGESGREIAESIAGREQLPATAVAEIVERVRARQRAIGYDGKYREWIARVTPSRQAARKHALSAFTASSSAASGSAFISVRIHSRHFGSI